MNLPTPPAPQPDDGRFPFGLPNLPRPARWDGTGTPRQLVLGVYPSALHTGWRPPHHLAHGARHRIGALAVDVEPEVFWTGTDAADRLAAWKTQVGFIEGDGPECHGHPTPATNGPSGTTLGGYFGPKLHPSQDTVFADIFPVFLVKRSGNSEGRRQQGDVQDHVFNPIAADLPGTNAGPAGPATLPTRPTTTALPRLAAARFGEWLVDLIRAIRPDVVVTLGQEPWTTLTLLSDIDLSHRSSSLAATRLEGYGEPGSLILDGHSITWIPLAHPGLLQGPSAHRGIPTWAEVHAAWAGGSVAKPENPTRTPDAALPASAAERAAENPAPPSIAEDDEAARAVVEAERSEIREFVQELTMDEIKSGSWFTKLLSHAMSSYTTKVDWVYFQEKYKGVPADGIVDQRIKMASRYAAIEGGLSASAYTVAIAATIGPGGGASPVVVPAALATVMVDVAYITQLQLRLAYDIAVLYRVPLDLSDPDDLWKLIRVAFTIKGGEVAREGVVKVVPVLVRPLIKRFYSKGVLAAAKGLPVVGKFLLQRTVIKVGIPLVGVPLAVLVNRYTTQITGRHARAVFRNEARVAEVAATLTECTKHPQLMLWVAWLVINADGKISDDEALLMRHLTRLAHERHQVVDDDLAQVVEVDRDAVWRRLDAETGDLTDIVEAGTEVAEIDGKINARERQVLDSLGDRCAR